METPKMVQLHSYITLETEQKIITLQALLQLKKNQKVPKQSIIMSALNDYLDYKILSFEKDNDGK